MDPDDDTEVSPEFKSRFELFLDLIRLDEASISDITLKEDKIVSQTYYYRAK